MTRMKRLQISLDPELDAALEREARREGVAKAALVRRWIAERTSPLPPLEEDPLWEWVGGGDADVDASLSVDDVVYPR